MVGCSDWAYNGKQALADCNGFDEHTDYDSGVRCQEEGQSARGLADDAMLGPPSTGNNATFMSMNMLLY